MQVREKMGMRPGGLGIMMTKSMVDDILYNEAQNEVVFVKYID
jgi:anti-sigma regulatory factor (Ser/Thr protein kinase)